MKTLLKLCLLVIVVSLLSGFALATGQIGATRAEQIEAYIEKNMDKFKIPGMSLVIVKDGEIILQQGFGVQRVGEDLSVNQETNFCLASVSKSFTALAILQLRDQGLLSLDEPVITYIPWFASKDKENSDQITIKHLMQHVSGIPTQAYGLEIPGGTEDDLEEQIKRLQEISLTVAPGTNYQYSNLNYWTQALIIEKLTGQKFADYMAENVFRPLGMERTGYYRQVADLGNLSSGHRVEYAQPKYFDYRVPDVINAAGGLYSNANDLAQYLIMILNNGQLLENQIISPNSLQEMIGAGFQLNPQVQYGYGWFIRQVSENMIVEHGGDNPNFTAHIYILPEEKIGFALLSNSQHVITHFLSGGLFALISGMEPEEVQQTGIENRSRLAKLVNLITLLLIIISAIWIVVVILGTRTGKYTFTTKIHRLRLILQGIVIPLIGLAILFYGLGLPKMMIGSYRIAVLYQPDLVNSLITGIIVVTVFTFIVGIMAFVKKTTKIDLSTLKK